MSDHTLGDLLYQIESTLPKWDWLLRSERRARFLCNLMPPNFDQNHVGNHAAWGNTPEEAMEAALAGALRELKDPVH